MEKKLFSSQLTQLRKKNNLSQSELGLAIGLSKQGINEIEKGRAKTTLDKAISIADYFDVTLDYLVGRTSVYEDTSISSSKKQNSESAAPALLTEQKELFQLFERLSTLDQGRILERMHILIEEGTGSTSK